MDLAWIMNEHSFAWYPNRAMKLKIQYLLDSNLSGLKLEITLYSINFLWEEILSLMTDCSDASFTVATASRNLFLCFSKQTWMVLRAWIYHPSFPLFFEHVCSLYPQWDFSRLILMTSFPKYTTQVHFSLSPTPRAAQKDLKTSNSLRASHHLHLSDYH